MTSAATQAQLQEQIMEGTVGRIIFRNEVDNFALVSMKSDDIPDFAKDRMYPQSFVVSGNFLRMAEGQRLRLKGVWFKTAQYGWRFKATTYEEIMPDNRNAMIDYLSSGLFKGIGPKTAEAIVDKFGDDTLNIIKNHPEKLATVKGISGVRASAIVKSYQESQYLEKLMLALTPYHIPTSKIVKINQRYGDKAMEMIQQNPYRLCEEVEGIGFKVADAMGRAFNISANDDARIRAGVIYTLSEVAASEGHVYLPFELMVTKTQEVLHDGEITGTIDRNDIIRVSISMNNAEELVMERDGAVYLPLYYAAEVYVGRKLQLMLQTKPKTFTLNMDTLIKDMEQRFGLKKGYATKQKEAFHMLPTTNCMVVTGGPGTGKTTIIKGIIEIFKRNFKGCKITLCAPTGRAAKRMEEATKLEAKTIHRLLEYRPNAEGEVACGRNEKNPIEADVIIIDESSMTDLLLCWNFLKAVTPETMVIFVGDIDQLPSVGAGNVLKDIIESNRVPVVRLNEIFRQADTSKIVVNAAKIRDGVTDLEFDENFQFVEVDDEAEIPEIIRKRFRDEYQTVKDINEVQILTPFRRKTETGSDRLNEVIQTDFNPKAQGKAEIRYGSRTFRKFDKVMQYRNNYDKEVFNGDLGVIKTIDNGQSLMWIEIDGEEVEYHKDEFDELQLAYAVTIHKSQGCEYVSVIIPVSFQHKRMLQRNLIYTGITRAKVRVILVGQRGALNYAIRNNKISQRFTKLKERI